MDPRLDSILRQLDRLPTLPAVALRVLDLAGSDAADARALADAISDDPALSARILQVLATTGHRRRVDSVRQAVTLLGFEQVRAAVLAVSVFDTFAVESGLEEPEPGASAEPTGEADHRAGLWQHSLAVAILAESLARDAGEKPGDAFLAGLLHDVGKIAFDAALPKSFRHVVAAADASGGDVREVEAHVIGLDHHAMGKRLAESWGLPAFVRDVAWLHNTDLPDPAEHTEHGRLVKLVSLADAEVRRLHLGYSGNHADADPARLAAELGVTTARLAGASAALVDTVGARVAALLPDAGGEQLFRRALVRTNRELGRVALELAGRNRELRRRGDFFDHAAAFARTLTPAATAADVLECVAVSASEVLGRPAAAFAVRGDVGTIATPAGTTDVAGVRPNATHDAEADPLRVAGEAHEWAAAQAGPSVGGPVTWVVDLASAGRVIGGVLVGGEATLGADRAEAARELRALSEMWASAVGSAQAREEARDAAEAAAESSRRVRAAEEDALRARTLMSLSQVAAGAAHEMNNPLMVISGRSQLLFQALKQSQPNHAAKAKLIFEQSQSLSEMISQLMEFAKPPRAQRAPVAVTELLRLAQTRAAERDADGWRGRRVSFDVPAELPSADVDAEQVADALAEVLTNAQQHTPAAGRIVVAASVEAGELRVSVADNGAGMAANVRAHACDPFFSAQGSGRRRGMGLAKALRRIDASGGWLKIDSQPGRGTIVHVRLPTASPDAGPAASRAA